jgi:hypothetical protein
MAVETEAGRFTVGVFQDIAWAERGVAALRTQGLAVESLSILGKASPEMSAFIERTLGAAQAVDVHDLGPAVARGPLVAALQGGDEGLSRLGIAGTMRRVGFQAHDGRPTVGPVTSATTRWRSPHRGTHLTDGSHSPMQRPALAAASGSRRRAGACVRLP